MDNGKPTNRPDVEGPADTSNPPSVGSGAYKPKLAEFDLRGGPPRAEWVVFDYETNSLVCKRCTRSTVINLPVSMDAMLYYMTEFLMTHKECVTLFVTFDNESLGGT